MSPFFFFGKILLMSHDTYYVTIHPRHVCIYVTIHPGERCTSCLLLFIVTIYFVTCLLSPLFYIRDAIHL